MLRPRTLAFAPTLLAASLAASLASAQPEPPPGAPADPEQPPRAPADPEQPPQAAPEPPPGSVAERHPGPAQQGSRAAPTATREAERPPHYLAPQWGVGVKLGPRYAWVRSEGLDPFAGIDVVPGFSLEAQLRVWHRGPTSLWALGNWSVGGASNTARGLPSSYTFHTLLLGLEGHQQIFSRRFYALARVAPGAYHSRFKVSPYDLDYALGDTSWTWAVEATLGAAVLLGAVGDDDWPSARFWLTTELGYALSGTTSVQLRPRIDDDEEQRRHGVTRLPDFNGSGVLLRIAAGMTF